MKPLDEILNEAVTNKYLVSSLAVNLNKYIVANKTIPEKQSKLVVKLLTNNKQELLNKIPELEESLEFPQWSKPFRPAHITRKVYIIVDQQYNLHYIVVESSISNVLPRLIRPMKTYFTPIVKGSKYMAPATEQTIFEIVEKFSFHRFEIHPTLLAYHAEMKEWNAESYTSRFTPAGMDLTFKNSLMEYDRRILYQYRLPLPSRPKNLTEYIAYRQDQKLWVNNKKYSITDVLSSLESLERFPLLIITNLSNDEYKVKEDIEEITRFSKSKKIGIYFRYPEHQNKKVRLNEFISDNSYNNVVDENTDIVVISSSKFPKFLLTVDWKPMAVLSLHVELRSNAVAVYARQCDLVISYTNTQSLFHWAQLEYFQG